MKNNKLVFWLVVALLFTIYLNFTNRQQAKVEDLGEAAPIEIVMSKTNFVHGREVIATVRNNTETAITFTNECPNEPLMVERYSGGDWEQTTADTGINCKEGDVLVAAQDKMNISYGQYTYSLFDRTGRYRISGEFTDTEEVVHEYTSKEFEIKKESWIVNIFRKAFYIPIYNMLVYLINIMPGRSLGLAIVLLTAILRLILLIPNHKALKSQKALQDIQPKIDEIKKKHKGNQQAASLEIMQLWKDNKVNPAGSCLPMLIQFPILIALFYVIKDGLNPDKIVLVYDFLSNVTLDNIKTMFLWLDLTKINFYVLPFVVGGLQFAQMKLMQAKKKKTTGGPEHGRGKKKKKDKKAPQDTQAQMQNATKMMTYFMPVMIAFFTASMPAGVGIYWGTSTLFGIGQQLFINKGSEKKSDEPTIKIINKSKK